MFRKPRLRCVLGVVVATVVVGIFGTPVSAQTETKRATDPARLAIIAVQGQLDPITTDFISRSLRIAESDGSLAFLIQLDSSGAAKPNDRVKTLADQLRTAKVPVAVWVGGDQAEATGDAFELVQVADFSGAATRTKIGDLGSIQSAPDAQLSGVIDAFSPTLGEFIVDLDGKRLDSKIINTTTTVLSRDGYRQEPVVVASFAKPSLVGRVLHAVTQPWVAYLLFVAGLLLIAFEFYALGVGIATAVGAACLVLAASGLAEQHTRVPAAALMVLSIAAFCVDTQSGSAKIWNAIGAGLFTLGSLTLFPPNTLPVLAVALVLACTLAVAVLGLPATVRARCNMPAIGREWLIGEQGKVTKVEGNEALVDIRGATWRASGERLTPSGTASVSGADGLILEISGTNTTSA